MSFEGNIERVGHTTIWSIKNFSYCVQRKGESISSPSFTVEDSKWQLRLKPRDFERGLAVSFFLHRVISDSGPASVSIQFEMSLINAEGLPEKLVIYTHHDFEEGETYGCINWCLREELFLKKREIYLPEDTLTIRFRMWNIINELSKATQFSAFTQILVDRSSFIWRIEKFSSISPGDKMVHLPGLSDRFSELSLNFYLSGGSTCEETVGIEISEVNCTKRNFLTCKISVIDCNGNAVSLTVGENIFAPNNGTQVWHFTQLITRSKLLGRSEKYLPNDTLSLRFEFGISFGDVTTEIDDHGPQTKNLPHRIFNKGSNCNHSSSMGDNLENIYYEEFLCDINLIAEGYTFPAHRVILAAKSPYFKAIFETHMRDQTGDYVDIEDVDAVTMQLLLDFVYLQIIFDFQWDQSLKLYFAADKFSMVPLKDRCFQMLKNSMSVFNACDILILADTHHDDDLKSAV